MRQSRRSFLPPRGRASKQLRLEPGQFAKVIRGADRFYGQVGKILDVEPQRDVTWVTLEIAGEQIVFEAVEVTPAAAPGSSR